MINENAGDRVFADVDEALAEKIISRSKKNSEHATPPVDTNKNNNRRKPISPMKIVISLGALLILALLIFLHKDKNNDKTMV